MGVIGWQGLRRTRSIVGQRTDRRTPPATELSRRPPGACRGPGSPPPLEARRRGARLACRQPVSRRPAAVGCCSPSPACPPAAEPFDSLSSDDWWSIILSSADSRGGDTAEHAALYRRQRRPALPHRPGHTPLCHTLARSHSALSHSALSHNGPRHFTLSYAGPVTLRSVTHRPGHTPLCHTPARSHSALSHTGPRHFTLSFTQSHSVLSHSVLSQTVLSQTVRPSQRQSGDDSAPPRRRSQRPASGYGPLGPD